MHSTPRRCTSPHLFFSFLMPFPPSLLHLPDALTAEILSLGPEPHLQFSNLVLVVRHPQSRFFLFDNRKKSLNANSDEWYMISYQHCLAMVREDRKYMGRHLAHVSPPISFTRHLANKYPLYTCTLVINH